MSKKETKPKDFSKLSKEELIKYVKSKFKIGTEKDIVKIIEMKTNKIINSERNEENMDKLYNYAIKLRKAKKELIAINNRKDINYRYESYIADMEKLFNKCKNVYNKWLNEENRRKGEIARKNEQREIAIKNIKDDYKYGTDEWICTIAKKYIKQFKENKTKENKNKVTDLIYDLNNAIKDIEFENTTEMTKGAFDTWIKELKETRAAILNIDKGSKSAQPKETKKEQPKEKTKETKKEQPKETKSNIPKNFLSTSGFIRFKPNNVNILNASKWLEEEINKHNISIIDGREIEMSIVKALEAKIRYLNKNYKTDENYKRYMNALTKELDNANEFLKDLYYPREGNRFNNLLDSERVSSVVAPKLFIKKGSKDIYDPNIKVERLKCFQITYNMKNGKEATKYIHYDPIHPVKNTKIAGEDLHSLMTRMKINRF